MKNAHVWIGILMGDEKSSVQTWLVSHCKDCNSLILTQGNLRCCFLFVCFLLSFWVFLIDFLKDNKWNKYISKHLGKERKIGSFKTFYFLAHMGQWLLLGTDTINTFLFPNYPCPPPIYSSSLSNPTVMRGINDGIMFSM